MVNVINLTNVPFKLEVSLKDADNWEASDLTPTQLDGKTVAANSQEEVHVEIADGQTSAKFVLTLSNDAIGTIATVADAYPVVNDGNRKGYLVPGGTAQDKFRILEAQYPKQPWENFPGGYDWRHLGLIIMPKIDPRSWMSRVGNDAHLNDITIPGSHDTGTAPINGTRQCQNLSIAQQLNVGIRFLDIRLNKDRNWEIMHENTATGLFFMNDCLLPIVDFLAENSSETVLLCIKDEHGSTDGFHDDILAMLGQLGASYVYTGKVPDNLGKLRGKLVLVRRYWIDPDTNRNKADGDNSGLGLHEFNSLPDGTGTKYDFPPNSDTFDELGDGNIFYQQPGGLPFAVQDWYDLQTSYMSDKISLIYKYLDAAKNTLAGTWFLNFSSCSTSARDDDPKDFAVGETNINDALFLYAITRGKGRYGIIPMDFAACPPEEATVNLLINCNWLS
jgi:hypothetical protein